MVVLNQYEMDCLRRISAQSSDSVAPCSEAIIQRLLTSGLIEISSTVRLPLEMSRLTYRITPLGSKLLKESDVGK